MTVKVYIWKGTNPDLSVYNAPNNVGHVAMHIIDDTKLNKDIYISHRPGKGDKKSDKNLAQWIYVFLPPVAKAGDIEFNEDCKKRTDKDNLNGYPHAEIEIQGLDEAQMRALWEEYDSNKLEISKYHIKSSNCSRAVVTFLKAGLKCPGNKMCRFCAPTENVSKHRARRALIVIVVISPIVFLFRSYVSSNRIDYATKSRADYFREQFQKPVDPNTGYRRIELPPPNQFDGWTPIFIFLAILGSFLYAANIFFDIELLGAGWAKMKLWSPQTVEIFANKVRDHVSQKPKKLCKKKRFLFF